VLGPQPARLARDGVLSFPAQRSTSVNLVATRGGGTPAVWLMAHLDSKSQPIPILVRALGITVLGLTWLAGMVVAIVQRLGDKPGWICGGVGGAHDRGDRRGYPRDRDDGRLALAGSAGQRQRCRDRCSRRPKVPRRPPSAYA
jgi:hypothetical protein